MNKVTFCSYPDIIDDENCYAIKNYDNEVIRNILNQTDDDTVFYLIDKNSSNQWLNTIQKKVKIIFDCKKVSLQQIRMICQKK